MNLPKHRAGCEVLGGFSPNVFVEIHGPDNSEKVLTLMQSLGYDCGHITRGHLMAISTTGQIRAPFSKELLTHHFLFEKNRGCRTHLSTLTNQRYDAA